MKNSKKGSTRQMMGITAMENDQVNTAMGDLVYYAVKPTNIGVLPESIIRDRVFRENAIAPTNPQGIRIDSRRRKKLMEKRLALGHKPNDHEQQVQAY